MCRFRIWKRTLVQSKQVFRCYMWCCLENNTHGPVLTNVHVILYKQIDTCSCSYKCTRDIAHSIAPTHIHVIFCISMCMWSGTNKCTRCIIQTNARIVSYKQMHALHPTYKCTCYIKSLNFIKLNLSITVTVIDKFNLIKFKLLM